MEARRGEWEEVRSRWDVDDRDDSGVVYFFFFFFPFFSLTLRYELKFFRSEKFWLPSLISRNRILSSGFF